MVSVGVTDLGTCRNKLESEVLFKKMDEDGREGTHKVHKQI